MRKLFIFCLIAIGILAGCERPPSADQQAARQTEQLAQEANAQVGMPGITNFTEKRIVAELYELRDQNISTYTYIIDYQGRLFHLCDSIGYGVPFSAQFSNPERVLNMARTGVHYGTLPQPEPNGLFPPTSSSATWVICSSPDGEFTPVYSEPLLIVSPFPLNNVGSYR